MAHSKRSVQLADITSPARIITDAIIVRLEAGTRTWIKPWTGVATPRFLWWCGTPYRGCNIFWLWFIADLQGFNSPFWMTYRQATALGGQVCGGGKSTIAIFYKTYGARSDDGATAE